MNVILASLIATILGVWFVSSAIFKPCITDVVVSWGFAVLGALSHRILLEFTCTHE